MSGPSYVYDIETYCNIFTFSVEAADTDDRWVFEISDRRNDRERLVQFLNYLAHTGARLVGFNNLGFDWPCVDHVIQHPDCTAHDVYQKAMAIITAPDNQRNLHTIWNPWIPQVDLYKIHHFDNNARQTSLKALEFAMKLDSIEDLPFAPGSYLSSEQMDTLIQYNLHDVEATKQFYHLSSEQIRFREELSAKYSRDFMNHNDTKIGKDYMIMELERLAPGTCYVPGTRTPRQTPRESIALADVIFPYVRFEQPEFQRIHAWLQSQVITETKGVFKKAGKRDELIPGKYVPPCVVNGFEFHFGTGGIHGSVSSRTVRSDAEHVILDVDVTSLYPSLGIVNRLYPEHLGERFCDIYADVKRQRVGYPKGTAENAMLKLALNGVYGDSNNPYSVFYDPKYTMSITINGQLLLCMLAEKLMYVPGLEMIQINTDGVTVRLPRENVWLFDEFCQWWQTLTRLDLERVEYRELHLRDVNSYIAVTTSGKVKSKGAYEHKDLAWHKDQSALVIPKAAEAFLLHGTPIREFITIHDDPMDFMMRAKVPRNSRLMLGGRQVQNVTRFYVSHTGGELVKVMPPLAKSPGKEREIGICVGWVVTECNRLAPLFGLNYEYYITEAEKLVRPLQ